ncbi:MAG: UDP-3-O-(3-hydroxymyristoyl)glucosamine N-acyltransferase [Gammaproteobacteria bacterium]|nr:UDP-3-O-(3-hydroxymyristoyl)glucosamine N-acyltransferase [Gammaproteobacteria bacterium]
MGLKLGDIAIRYGCELLGDPRISVEQVGTLAAAQGDAIAFLANSVYRSELKSTAAAAVILSPDLSDDCPVAALVCTNPYLVFAQLAGELHPAPPLSPGLHPAASIAPDCQVPETCRVAAGAVLESGVVLGERVYVGPNAVIGQDCQVGDDTQVLAGALILHEVSVGCRCILHPGAVIGSDGFGNASDATGAWVKVPQLGGVRIGNDVEIGANTTVDRGAIGDTLIADGVRIDNQVQIAHNVEIGPHTAIAALTGISGSTKIGAHCMVGGQVGFAGHLTIADQVGITGGTAVTHSLTKPGIYGGPAATADDAARWRRNAVRYRHLDDLARRLRALEKKTEDLLLDD